MPRPTTFLIFSLLALVGPSVARADQIELRRDDVVPVIMRSELTFRNAREGDRFSATVEDNRMLPWGSKLEGRVKRVEQKRGDRPAFMDIEFTSLILPDGHRTDFRGTPIALSKDFVTRDKYGRWEAKKGVRKETMVLGGAAAGFLLGSMMHKQFEGTVVGALAGIVVAESDKQHVGDGNIVIPKGARFGALVNEPLTVTFNGRWDARDSSDGFGKDGYNRNGYDRYGYDRNGRYNSRYDTAGSDRGDYRDGYDRYGYDREGHYNPRYDTTRSERSSGRDDGSDRYPDNIRNGSVSSNMRIEVDGRTLRFSSDERPYRVGSTVMVPVDPMAEQLDIRVSKDRASGWIVLELGDDVLRFEQETGAYRLNERRGDLEVRPEQKSGLLFAPLELFSMLKRGPVLVNGTRY